jgi:2-oxoglutarate dehydrogenase complex dehydrogenase (E1) component-like enzyme
MTAQNIVRLTFRNETAEYTYLMESSVAERVQEFFKEERKDEIIDSFIEEASSAEIKSYKTFQPKTQTMQWMKSLEETMGFKIMPGSIDGNPIAKYAQPKDDSLMMAFYHLEAEDLRKNIKPLVSKKVWGMKG